MWLECGWNEVGIWLEYGWNEVGMRLECGRNVVGMGLTNFFFLLGFHLEWLGMTWNDLEWLKI